MYFIVKPKVITFKKNEKAKNNSGTVINLFQDTKSVPSIERDFCKARIEEALIVFATVISGCISLACFSVSIGVSLAEKTISLYNLLLFCVSVITFFLFGYFSTKHQQKTLERTKIEKRFSREYGRKRSSLENKVRQMQKEIDKGKKGGVRKK